MLSQQIAASPQAMAPIAFTIATISLSHGFNVGAAMVSTMTACQIVSAVPLSRLGRRADPIQFLRRIQLCRAAALLGLAVARGAGAGPMLLIGLAGLAGIASGPIFGSFRSLLGDLVPAAGLPRALALSATANEFVFVAGPVVAAFVGSASGPLALVLIAVGAGIPALLLPRLQRDGPDRTAAAPGGHPGQLLSTALTLWLFCALASSATTAAIETGAVSLAEHFGQPAKIAAVFTVALCIASISGGVILTVANQILGLAVVFGLLVTTMAGALAIGFADRLWLATLGCVLVGLCLAPLNTFFSIAAEGLLPASRRAEGFSLLRAAQGSGIVLSALLLTFLSVDHVAVVAAGLMAAAAVVVPLGRANDVL
jgi:hypothetical protein